MMINRDQFHILLVHPPVVSPAAPPWIAAQVAAHLTGLCMDQYDANLDFFLNHFLAPENLTGLADVIEDRERQGIFKDIDTDTITLLADLAANREHWERKIDQVDRRLKLLRTDDFYMPERCLSALKEIRDLLSLGSLAFYPSCIRWDGYSNPTVRDRTQVRAFLEDPDTNPFLFFCQQRLALRVAHPNLGLIIFTVCAPDQLLAALTMARFCKKQRPAVHVAFLGHDTVLPLARDYSDTQLSETDLNPLLELVARLKGINVGGQPTAPDFSGLPLMDYLAPALTLPSGVISGPSSDLPPHSSLFTVLKEQVTDLRAECFLMNDDRLTPDYMAEVAADMAGQRPVFCLGLTCALDGSTSPEAIAAARQIGVRLICWRDPAGQLETLTKTLWDAAKTNVWNHVVIPAERGNSLVKDLTHFMAANPNIVHSWSRQRSPVLPFENPVDLADEALGDYAKVALLPGRSFWRCLNDPVYLLLYVNRHDVKKLMRFRVQDDASSVRVLGANMVFHFVKPQELQPEYLDEICRMVEAGGSVGSTWVRYNLERAFLIGYAIENGVIVGNSSLKHPRPQYVKAVNKQSGLDLSKYLERGYTSVRPEYRGMGIGTRLLEGLTARAGKRKIFSIISEDNAATQKIALRNNTRRVVTFFSERLGKDVGVWIPERMLED